MQTTVLIILGAFLLVLQTTVFTLLPPWLGNPDLLFLLALFISTRIDLYQGVILILVLGLMMDVFSGIIPGLYPAIYLGLFVTIKLLSRQVIVDEPVHQPPLAASGFLACSGALYIYTLLFSPGTDLVWSWRELFLQMFILAVLSLPFFHLLSKLMQVVSADKRRRWMFLRGKAGNRFIS